MPGLGIGFALMSDMLQRVVTSRSEVHAG